MYSVFMVLVSVIMIDSVCGTPPACVVNSPVAFIAKRYERSTSPRRRFRPPLASCACRSTSSKSPELAQPKARGAVSRSHQATATFGPACGDQSIVHPPFTERTLA